jgi:hypothetical protein
VLGEQQADDDAEDAERFRCVPVEVGIQGASHGQTISLFRWMRP